MKYALCIHSIGNSCLQKTTIHNLQNNFINCTKILIASQTEIYHVIFDGNFLQTIKNNNYEYLNNNYEYL